MNRLRLHARENWYRDVWLLVVSLAVLFAVKANQTTLDKVQEGRRAGTAITCVITSSILVGSHAFIIGTSAVPLPERLEHRLISEGYPAKASRETATRAEADAYTKAIGDAVVNAVGKEGQGLIVTRTRKGRPPAGTLNCERLKAIVQVR